MSMQRPTVTVLMSVYNGQRFLREAIESILGQSFTDFELLVIDDGSEDSSSTIVRSYRDSRIRVIQNAVNRGLAASLNIGLTAAAGRYIARMDADDVSKPARLARQVAYMESHPRVGICGTWVEVEGMGRQEVVRYPIESEVIHSWLLFESALAHPSIIINRDRWVQAQLSYNPSFPCAQDYDLWVRAARAVLLANQPEVLLTHRLHQDQVGDRLAETQKTWADKVRRTQLQLLGLESDGKPFAVHQALSTWSWTRTRQFVAEADAWLRLIEQANHLKHVYPEPAFSRVIGERWLAVCQSVEPDPRRLFWSSPLSGAVDMGWKNNWRRRIRRGLARLRRPDDQWA